MITKVPSKNPYSFDALTKFANKNPLYPKRKSIVSNLDSVKTTKGINRQQAVKGVLAVVEEFCYPIAVITWVRCIGVFYSKPFENFIAPHTTEYRYNSDNTEQAIVYQEVKNFLQEKIDSSLSKSINKKTIKVENDLSENQVDEDLTEYYEQSESPEIVNSFLVVMKSMPVINEQYDSIYSDEELDELYSKLQSNVYVCKTVKLCLDLIWWIALVVGLIENCCNNRINVYRQAWFDWITTRRHGTGIV